MPRPFPPRTSGHELAADLPPRGMFRVYEWLDHRPLSTDDEIGEWLGRTLAVIHELEPVPRGTGPDWYGLHSRETWLEWIDNANDPPWTQLARERLPLVEELTERITRAFDNAGDPVRTHSDIEPWNVLYTARGPVLIDWDTGGIDSATLQAAQAAYAFAGGDIARTGEILAAYRAAGGHVVDLGPDLLMRRAGLQLSRLGYDIAAGDAAKITRKFAELPQFVAELTAQSREIAQGL
jgi:Ser/Thr protein kinase RdoA (MazF antagonist)